MDITIGLPGETRIVTAATVTDLPADHDVAADWEAIAVALGNILAAQSRDQTVRTVATVLYQLTTETEGTPDLDNPDNARFLTAAQTVSRVITDTPR